MNIQAAFNESAISMLPQIKKVIEESSPHERDQILSLTLRMMDRTFKPVSHMNKKELKEFQNEVLMRLYRHGYA